MPDLSRRPRASLIVLNWNGRELLARCLPSVVGQDYPHFETLLVDNGSTDGSLEWVASAYPQVRLLPQGRNLGFAGGMNAGLRESAASQSELVACLNNDVILRPDWLRRLAEAMMADERIGVAGCKLLYPEGNLIQHAGGILHYPSALPDHFGFRQPDTGQFEQIKDVDYVTGAALAVRREMLDQIGGFDEGFYPIYYEETDLCFRARAAGWRVVYIPQAVATHLESSTTVRDSPAYYAAFHKGRLRFVLKHYTPEQFLNDFMPAERARWPGGIAAAEREPLRQAYLNAAQGLDAILAVRPGQPIARAVAEQMRLALNELAIMAALESAESLVEQMDARAMLREYVFVSRLPVIGPLVARFRALWNAVSTKWYVRALATQQSEFNALTVQALRQLEESQANLIAADRQISALTRRVAILEQQLRQSDADRVL